MLFLLLPARHAPPARTLHLLFQLASGAAAASRAAHVPSSLRNSVAAAQQSGRIPALWRQFEAGKLEAGRDGAADQRPIAGCLRRLPGMGGHDALWPFALG